MSESERIFTATSTDGTKLGCVVDGAGPPLLMVHGTGDTHLGFRRARPILAKHFTLYMMDRRGRGISGDNDDYSFEQEFDDVAAVLDAIGGPVNLFAHSVGAVCAMEGARRAHHLKRLAVYEPSMNRTAHDPEREFTIDEMRRLIAAGDRDATVALHLSNVIHAPAETIAKQRSLTDAWAARMKMAHTMPRELHALRDYPFEPERFAHLGVPVRMIVGTDSVGRGPDTARKLAAAIPNADVVFLEGAGHFGMLTVPERFAETLIEFFEA